MRMGATFLFAFAMAGISGAQAAPAQLYGKSISLSWTETREQKKAGDTDFHGQALGQHLTVYVSPTGKLFNRIETNVGKRRGSNDQVAGDSGSSRGLSFHGSQLEVFGPFGGGMRHLVVSFDASFASCTMRASFPSDAAGGPKRIARTLVGGAPIEIRNVSGSGETCSVQAGNAFAQ
jgi:hypothetical protein